LPDVTCAEASDLRNRGLENASGTRRLIMAFARSAGAWFDAPTGTAISILLGLFTLLWTLFHIISFASTDLHPDFLEVYAWSRHPSLGYYKHPPLDAWIAWLWFHLLPAQDWAFWLLAMVNAAVALFAIDCIARHRLSGDKRIVALLLLLLTPFYQFRAQPFGANQMLLSTWPVAVYCFLRAFETRRPSWAIAAGCAAALSMLGKYNSVFLILGLAVAPLAHRNGLAYFRSVSPWLSVVSGLVVLTPNLVWLGTTGFMPFHYAVTVHADSSLSSTLMHSMTYFGGAISYLTVLLAVYLVSVRPNWATLQGALWPSDSDGRMLAVLLWVPIIAPIPVAIAINARLSSLWTMQAWFLLPILLLSPQRAIVSRSAAIGIAAFVSATSLGALAVSPALAWAKFFGGVEPSRLCFQSLATEATERWQATTGRPLSIAAGDPDLAAAVSFYGKSHPDAVPIFDIKKAPWVNSSRQAQEGFIGLCKADDTSCLSRAQQIARDWPDAVRVDLHPVPRFAGRNGIPQDYTMWLMPPLAH